MSYFTIVKPIWYPLPEANRKLGFRSLMQVNHEKFQDKFN